jgi:hypothetical protein
MANVQILKVGHALVQGERGEKGGKPSKDSIWGVAMIYDRLVTFSGRRNAVVFKFKTHRKADMENVLALYAQKLEGKDVKGTQYVDIGGDAAQELLVPGLVERVREGFNKAKKAGKIDTRSTVIAKKAVTVETETATVSAQEATAA